MVFQWPAYKVTNSYFLIPTEILGIEVDGQKTSGPWAQFSRAERAVYPVLLSHSRNGRAFVAGEVRLAAMSGLAKRESARIATNALEDRGIITIKRGKSCRQPKSYTINMITSQREMPFYRDMIYSGMWAWLGRYPTAQALYLAMRYLARPRPDLDEDFGIWPSNDDEMREYLMERDADYCLSTQREMLDHSGIARRSFPAAVSTLTTLGLISPYYDEGFLVGLGKCGEINRWQPPAYNVQ
jgi:hypothetical protein